jgi:hypothetical protein
MRVSQVIEIAKEWVEENVSQLPGFCGAYLGGSLSRMQKDASFPTYDPRIVKPTSFSPSLRWDWI